MKHLKFNAFLLTLLLSMAGITAAAHDIEVENNGKKIYYVWTNDNTELAVSFQGSSYGNYSNEYSGNVVIPESVTYNGATYPVTSIGASAFNGCSSLTSVTIPNSVTTIGNSAFYGCSNLTSVTIPNSVTSIDIYAFTRCSGLTSVTIGNSVTSIGSYAFRDCSGLTSVTIPESVTSIGQSAFEGCSGLTSVKVASDNSTYDSRDNCNAIIETASNTLIAGCKSTIIPNSVTSIGDYAFRDCSGLTSVTIPNSVTSIGRSAFSGCSGLESMTVASGNSTYDSRDNCNAIIETASNTLIAGCKSTIIPNSVTSIGDAAFGACSGLTSVTIPSSVTSIGGYAFYNCSGLTDVFCYAENVPTTSTSAFYESPISSATLHVPAASLSSYQTTEPWSGFGNIVGDIVLKCATPTIAFANGKLTFECETEGVEYVYDISMTGSQSGRGNDIVLPSLPNTYAVSVYATKEGWVDSDVATKTLTFQAKTGDANGDGEITIADITILINTILGNGNAAGSRAKVTENEEGR